MTQVLNAAASLQRASESYQDRGATETLVVKASRHLQGRWQLGVVAFKGAAELVFNIFKTVFDALAGVVKKEYRQEFWVSLRDAKEGGKISFIGVVGAVVCPSAAIWLMGKVTAKKEKVEAPAAAPKVVVVAPANAAPIDLAHARKA